MMTRKPGDKTMKFLNKLMRVSSSHPSMYQCGDWVLWVWRTSCELSHEQLSENIIEVNRAASPEAAIAECERQTLALFKQLGELAGYEVEE